MYPSVRSPARNRLPVIGTVRTGFGDVLVSDGWRRCVSCETCRDGSGRYRAEAEGDDDESEDGDVVEDDEARENSAREER